MEANETTMSDIKKLWLVILAIAVFWLFYQLSPILTPFFIAATLAYLGDPLVDKLESWRLSRTVSVCVVFAVLLIAGLVLLLILIPMLGAQIGALIKHLPDYLISLQQTLQPKLTALGLPANLFDPNTIKQTITHYWSELGQVAGGLFHYMTRSGVAVIQWIANLLLVPVLTFYLLRDWDILVARFRELLPRRYKDRVIRLSLECDDMLASFMRGQLMVMFSLATIYTIGLSLIGLELALLIGVFAGLVSFVPYLGLIVGISFAGLAAYLQFHEWLPLLWVVLVFGIAQGLEGTVLTPRFVGERIGLHPVAVIFAVLAGGQLFGFMGILLALPVASMVVVLLRHVHEQYKRSELYS